jgi:hypothetical protein
MPYVPKVDREELDIAVEKVAQETAERITNNFSLVDEYEDVFDAVATHLNHTILGRNVPAYPETASVTLGKTILEVARKYDYEGAFLGELNYSITRLIQRVPQIKVARGDWKESDEFRYWLYACTAESLTHAASKWDTGIGISGVFEDIKDEYKRRVNTAYEAAQIVKNGDCYDAPYYTREVEIQDESGNRVGTIQVMFERNEETLKKDILDGIIVLKQKS